MHIAAQFDLELLNSGKAFSGDELKPYRAYTWLPSHILLIGYVSEGWVKWRKSKLSSNHLSWMSYIRELGRYMLVNDYPDAYVLTDEFKAKMVRITPYLLSQKEVEAFFSALSSYKPKSSWAWQATGFFGLMHSCGLRTCEVQRLRVSDVDLENLFIDIVWSKGNRSRRLHITAEIAAVLAACDAKNEATFGCDRKAFFVSSTGNPVASSSIGTAFRRIWLEAGLPESKGGKRPRPYDFRHRFAYANLERWRADGSDIEAMLPYLARYMGHSAFDSTYYYVHTSPDFLSEYADIVNILDSLLPEVGFDA